MNKLSQRFLVFILLVGLTFMLFDSPVFGRILYPLNYQGLIEDYAQRHQLEPSLVAAVIRVESSFRTQAVSKKGARGLMQLMPTTAQWILSQQGIVVTVEEISERLDDPELNISLGTWYLANLSKEFSGDEAKILAAYNAGRGNVRFWLEQSIWDGTFENRAQIPFAETRDYLGKVLIAQERYKSYYNLP